MLVLSAFSAFASPLHAEGSGPSDPAGGGSDSASTPVLASDPQLDEARKVAASAERLFDAGHFQAALAEYSRAYAILAGHPRQYFVLYNLAACNERLFRYDVALRFYEEYLRRAPDSEKDRTAVIAIMRTLRSLLGTLVVDSAVPASIWADDRLLGTAPGRWLLPAGSHVVEARAELRESMRREVRLSAGEQLRLYFEPKRLSTYTGPSPRYFWATTALTGVAVLAGATFGALALSARESGRERAAYYLDTQAEARRTRRYALAADIAFGAAALLGTSATVLYFITDWGPPTETRGAGQSASFSESRPRGGSATLRMAF